MSCSIAHCAPPRKAIGRQPICSPAESPGRRPQQHRRRGPAGGAGRLRRNPPIDHPFRRSRRLHRLVDPDRTGDISHRCWTLPRRRPANRRPVRRPHRLDQRRRAAGRFGHPHAHENDVQRAVSGRHWTSRARWPISAPGSAPLRLRHRRPGRNYIAESSTWTRPRRRLRLRGESRRTDVQSRRTRHRRRFGGKSNLSSVACSNWRRSCPTSCQGRR